MPGAAVLLVEGEPEQAELGVLLPQLAAPAEVGVEQLQAGVRVVALVEQAVHRVGEQALFLGQVEVHVCSRQNFRIALAMIVRCTSLEPA